MESMKSMKSMKTMVEINMIFISSLRSILGKQWEVNGWVLFFRVARENLKTRI